LPEAYWNDRLARAFNEAGTGMQAYGVCFNWWVYQVCRVRFRRVVGRLGLRARDVDVLDIGSGTGFYVRQWERLGVRRITGIDFAESAVNGLARRFPTHDFLSGDIGSPENPLPNGRFKAASAFSVLFHIVDDERYEQALRNIHASLLSGGYLVLSDNFVHQPLPPAGNYHVSRTLEHSVRAIENAGFSILERVPLLVLLGDPVDSESVWLHQYWRTLSWFVMRSNVAGAIAGAALFPLELMLTSVVVDSPTTEIMVCRRS